MKTIVTPIKIVPAIPLVLVSNEKPSTGARSTFGVVWHGEMAPLLTFGSPLASPGAQHFWGVASALGSQQAEIPLDEVELFK
jgi:hypothetical protein